MKEECVCVRITKNDKDATTIILLSVSALEVSSLHANKIISLSSPLCMVLAMVTHYDYAVVACGKEKSLSPTQTPP